MGHLFEDPSDELPPHSRQHRWARKRVKLPSEFPDRNFESEVAERTRQLIALRCSTPWEEAEQPRGQSLDPFKREEVSKSCPRYLSTACVSCPASTLASSRPASRGPEALLPQRPRCPPRTSRSSRSRPQKRISAAGIPTEASLKIVESPASLLVSTEEFGETKIPPRSWLLLDPSPHPPEEEASAVCDSSCGGEYQTDAPDADLEVAALASSREQSYGQREVVLSGAVGGGTVVASGGAQLLRPVPIERLHTAAAEANFRKASCGSSLVALRHAALILGLVNEKEALIRAEKKELGTVLDTRHHIRLPSSANKPLGSEIFGVVSRARRLEGCVANRAIAAQERAETSRMASRHSDDDDEEEQHDGHEHCFLGHNELHKKSVLHHGWEVLQKFLEFGRRKFGNPMRAWFQLDTEENMRLGQMQFIRRVQETGFRGNGQAMWKYLDKQEAGIITILDLHPPTAMLVAGFKYLVARRFGRKVKFSDLFDKFDENGSGKIYKVEFLHALDTFGYRGPSSRLFDLLDKRGVGWMGARDLTFLDKWQPPAYMYCKASALGLQAVKEALRSSHRSLLRGWRKVLDRDGSMRLTFKEWITELKKHNLQTSDETFKAKIPRSMDEIVSAWRALDSTCSGWVAIQEFDKPSYDLLLEFKKWAVKHHGGVIKAFRSLDDNVGGSTAHVGKLSRGELKRGIKLANEGFNGDIDELFNDLDLNDADTLLESEVRFLDNWDVEWEDWEVSTKAQSKLDFGLRRHPGRLSVSTMA